MVETKWFVFPMSLKYEGLFDAKELYRMLNHFFRQKGFQSSNPSVRETVHKDGKDIVYKWEPRRKSSDYSHHIIRTEISMHDVKEVRVKKDGKVLHLNSGRIEAKIEGILETDYENLWETQAFYQFMKTIMGKWLFKPADREKVEALKSDAKELHAQLQAFLNFYKY